MVQPIARQLGLTNLGTLDKRIGNTLALPNTDDDSSGRPSSAWGRVFGQQIDNRYHAFTSPRASGWLAGFQAGLDLWRHVSASGGRDTAGLYFAYSHADTGIDGLVTNAAATGYVLTRAGTLNLNAYSAGAYWTHYCPSG